MAAGRAFYPQPDGFGTRFEERCRRQAEALERAKLLNEQAEQLKKEADRLGNQ